MRIRLPPIMFGVMFIVGSVTTTLGASVATAPRASGGSWAVTGVDVSHWQDTIDWNTAAGSVDFAIIKATESQRIVDPMFATNAANAAAAGVTIGMYHVASPSASKDDARAEANHFLSVAAPHAGNLIPALDIEINRVPDWMTPTQLETWSRAWLLRVTKKLGVRPMVYGSIYMFQTLLANTTWFADNGYPLWLARWGALPATLPANDWQGQGWTFWQWSSTGKIPGITGNVDRDRFVDINLVSAKIAGVTAQPGAGGSIADDSGRLTCAAGQTCTTVYSPNDPLQLTATPNAGYSFVSWGGACAAASTTPTCSLTALGNKTVTATFSHRLKVRVEGSGIGTVMSSPSGIACPGTCTAIFAPGATVTLTAEPDQWSGLAWSGDCTGSDPNGCVVTMDQQRAVTATFKDLAPATATIKPPGSRTGPVLVRFDEPVHRVTTSNLVLRPKGGKALAGTLRCFGAQGNRTPCDTGDMRSATFQPAARLQRGQTYVAVVDPVGAKPIVDRAGKPTPSVRKTFTL